MVPALEWRAKVQHITEMKPGDRTGYGGTYVATERERIALLPIGYADGYPRQLSNCGGSDTREIDFRCAAAYPWTNARSAFLPRLDLLVGDELTILGPPQSGAPDANQLGEIIGTIGYEIVSRLSRRIPVDYI